MSKEKNVSESSIERYLVTQTKKIGGKSVKMVPTFENGIPDRQILYQGRTIFVELKKEGEKPAKLQVAFMQELNKHGFETRVIDSKELVDQLIRDLIDENGKRPLPASTRRS